MVKRIALFNHKGGVSKTTTTFNLGWMLASKGKTVILVDTDPQCNLTGLVLGYKGPAEFEKFYKNEKERNIRAGLAPAFESQPAKVQPVDCVQVPHRKNLLLLPGHIRLSEYEVTLGIAQELSGSIQTLQNLPGAISYLLDETAAKYSAEYVLVDMNPSLSSFNQNLLMTSHYFILPTSPDYFSVMAIDSLSTVIPNWHEWAQKASSLPVLRNAAYPFPMVTPKFLGIIIQKYRPRSGAPALGFQQWIDEIERTVESKFIPTLTGMNMMLPSEIYKKYQVGSGHVLAVIPDFNTLIAKSQKAQAPVFALTPKQIGQTGIVLQRTIKSRDNFKRIFTNLADKVIGLTDDDPSDRAI